MVNTMPAWVPAVMLILIAVGYRQTRPQFVKPKVQLGIAIGMVMFSLLGTLSAFGSEPLSIVSWLSGLIVMSWQGQRLFPHASLLTHGKTVQIPGSWMPMVVLLSIFSLKCLIGVAQSTHWAILDDPAFVCAVSGLSGALSGFFTARVAAVFRHLRLRQRTLHAFA